MGICLAVSVPAEQVAAAAARGWSATSFLATSSSAVAPPHA